MFYLDFWENYISQQIGPALSRNSLTSAREAFFSVPLTIPCSYLKVANRDLSENFSLNLVRVAYYEGNDLQDRAESLFLRQGLGRFQEQKAWYALIKREWVPKKSFITVEGYPTYLYPWWFDDFFGWADSTPMAVKLCLR